jgi:hypothetical protein
MINVKLVAYRATTKVLQPLKALIVRPVVHVVMVLIRIAIKEP